MIVGALDRHIPSGKTIRNDHYLEEPLNIENVSAAIHRYDTDTDTAMRGRLTISHLETIRTGKRIFARWDRSTINSGLTRMAVSAEEQALCDEFVATITGSDPNMDDPTLEAIIQKLDDATDLDDGDDQPIGMRNGKPLYPADRYDRSKGGY